MEWLLVVMILRHFAKCCGDTERDPAFSEFSFYPEDIYSTEALFICPNALHSQRRAESSTKTVRARSHQLKCMLKSAAFVPEAPCQAYLWL